MRHACNGGDGFLSQSAVLVLGFAVVAVEIVQCLDLALAFPY